MPYPDYSITQVEWNQYRSELRMIRESVFILEQKVPRHLELDSEDGQALHMIARDGAGTGIGTGRITQQGQIGRMAVLSQWRNNGIGSALLTQLIRLAHDRGMEYLFLNAQTQAIPFYQQHGFHCIGDEFIEAGIVHQRMEQTKSVLKPQGRCDE